MYIQISKHALAAAAIGKDRYRYAAASQIKRKWKEHRQRLIASKRYLEKTKTKDGVILTLTFNPQHFLWQDGDTYRHIYCQWQSRRLEVVNYTKERWFCDYDTIKSTGETYHPGYHKLCSVLFNTENNPVWLNAETKSAEYIERIEVEKKTNGSIRFDFHVSGWSVIGDRFKRKKPVKYTIDATGVGWPILMRNDKVVGDVKNLIYLVTLLQKQFYYRDGYSLHKDYMAVFRQIDPLLKIWLGRSYRCRWGAKTVQHLESQYACLRENRQLRDLPFSEIELMAMFNEESYHPQKPGPRASEIMLKHVSNQLANGDTKTAVDACFYGYSFPKSIKKLLIKAGFLRFKGSYYTGLYKAIEARGVDKTRDFITNPNQGGEIDVETVNNKKLMDAFTYGWNLTEYVRLRNLPNPSKKEEDRLHSRAEVIYDAIDMYSRLQESDLQIQLHSSNTKEIHDYLVPIYTLYARSKVGAEAEAIRTISTAEQLKTLSMNGFTVRSPYTAYELMDVGAQMRHCVSSYAESFYYRIIEIALLTNEGGDYLVCLEIKNNAVIQAKMRFNEPVKNNPEYLVVVEAFMALNDLHASTADIDLSSVNGVVGYQQIRRAGNASDKDEQRVAIVAELEYKQKERARQML